MSTIDADTAHTSDEAQQPPNGTLEHLSPNDLVLDENVRDDAAIDPEFSSSVKEHGVIVPIVAVRGPDGIVRVRAGQRRTVAARQAGLPTVPVYVRQAGEGDDNARQVERLAEQIVENDHRRSLTEAQRAKGIQQMLDAGASITKVAKKLSMRRDTVKAAAAAAGSAVAMDALGGGQLSLAEAAALAEFEDDPDAVAELMRVAGGGRFDHKLAEIRQRRESERAHQEAAAGYTAQGYTVLTDYPGWNDTARVGLRYLRTADGAAATEEAVTDPAHWAVYLVEDTAYVDKDTGAPVDGDDIDWYCRHSATGQPEDGKRHPDTVTERAVFIPEWFCTDHAAAGLDLCDALAKRTQPASRDNHQDDEANAAAQAEAARRERRRTIALNKLAAAAIGVRREFIRTKILARKTPPKGAAIFVASCLTRDMRLLDEYHGRATAAELLGVAEIDAAHQQVCDLGGNGDARAQLITLALVLGALEARSPKDAWRQSTTGWGHHVGTADLLAFLADHGYPLAAVELVMTKARSADDVYADTLRDPHDDHGDE